MATYTMAQLSDQDAVAERREPLRLVVQEINCAENNFAASDVIKAIAVGAGQLVMAAGITVVVAEGGTLTATLGDTDVDGFLASSDLNAAAGTAYSSQGGSTAYEKGKLYAAADTINVTLSANAADTAVFRVWALVLDVADR